MKTLKDFEDEVSPSGIGTLTEIRGAAIEWVKAIDTMEKTPQDKMYEQITGNTVVYSEDAKITLRLWIKHFFNLSEEDLK